MRLKGRGRTGRTIRLGLVAVLALGVAALTAHADGVKPAEAAVAEAASPDALAGGNATPIGGPAILVLLAIWVAALALPRR